MPAAATITITITVPGWLLCAVQACAFATVLSFVGHTSQQALFAGEQIVCHFAFCLLWRATFAHPHPHPTQ